MGLDFLDVLFHVRKRFNVVLRTDSFTERSTVGDVAQLLITSLNVDGSRSARGFHIARRLLVEELGVAREDVRLDSRLADLISRDRRSRWQQYSSAHFSLPRLRGSRFIELVVTLSTAFAIFTAVLTLIGCVAFNGLIGVAGVVIIAAAIAVRVAIIDHLCGSFPPELTTVEDLAHRLAPAAPPGEADTWKADEVLDEVCAIFAEATGRTRAEVNETTRIVEVCD